MLAVAATNAAVDAIVAGLAVELAPIRVNAIAPGTIDTGAYDALGAAKAALFSAKSAVNPARRIGTADDIAAAALAALTNGFLTGVSIPVDGGEHLVLVRKECQLWDCPPALSWTWRGNHHDCTIPASRTRRQGKAGGVRGCP
jgi:enoyl-[acyl-carrier-protein] reductase (NADH)